MPSSPSALHRGFLIMAKQIQVSSPPPRCRASNTTPYAYRGTIPAMPRVRAAP